MTNGQGPSSTSSPPIDESVAGMKDSVHQEAKGARRAFEETAADLSDRASGLASEAGQAIADRAESAKQGLSGNLKAFSDAMRAAADHLSQQQPAASKIVNQAAAGLDTVSTSLENKSFGEVAEDLRSMGRNNAAGLFAGSIIAGLALGRFLRSAEPQEQSQESAKGSTTDDFGRGASSSQGEGAGFAPAGAAGASANDPGSANDLRDDFGAVR